MEERAGVFNNSSLNIVLKNNYLYKSKMPPNIGKKGEK